MSDVLMFDSRGTFASLNSDLIDRHRIYIRSAKQESNGRIERLVVITNGAFNGQVLLLDEDILILGFRVRNLFKTFFTSRPALENQIKPLVISCSDPWSSFWLAKVFTWRKFLGADLKRVPIQIQLHSDVFSTNWRKANLKATFKIFVLPIVLQEATQIRCMSRSMADELRLKCPGIKSEIVWAPVPILLPEKPSQLRNEIPRTIGFVGRIHPERGLSEFVHFANVIHEIAPDIKFVIVGSGKYERKFKQDLIKSIPSEQIEFLGELDQKQMEFAWRQIGILVSTAPSESYGRTLREALVRGIAIWSTQTRGFTDVIEESNSPHVAEIRDFSSKAALEADLNSLLGKSSDLTYYESYSELRDKAIKDIGVFWAGLAEL